MKKKKKTTSVKAGYRQQKKPLSPGHGKRLAEAVEKIAVDVCDGEGIELVHVEFVSDSHFNILRVYIDKPGGVTMADCTNISRQLGDILDINLDINTEYRLEVSSPGIYRPLFKKKDYIKFSGKPVEIKTKQPIDGKKKLKGILNGISENDSVTLSVNGALVKIDFSSINSARLSEDNGDDRC